jgi:hypothetical protein
MAQGTRRRPDRFRSVPNKENKMGQNNQTTERGDLQGQQNGQGQQGGKQQSNQTSRDIQKPSELPGALPGKLNESRSTK